MQQPIVRKTHRTPRDFILSTPQHKKVSNLYTFNPTSSFYDSGYQQHADVAEGQLRGKEDDQCRMKVYYDAQKEKGEGIDQDKQKEKDKGELLSVVASQKEQKMSISSNIFFTKLDNKFYNTDQNHQSPQQSNPQPQLLKAMSGHIIKQKQKAPVPLPIPIPSPQHRTPQRQFNRFALSLLGIRRPKDNLSSLAKKHSFNIHQLSSTRVSREERYHDGNQNGEEEEIYRHSMYPFSVKKIDNIKREVNRILGESRLRRSNPEEEMGDKKETKQEKSNQFNEVFPNSNTEIKINIKTSLSGLKNLLSCSSPQSIFIQVPPFFLRPPSQLLKPQSLNPQILSNQCSHIFTSLSIPLSTLTIRKYSNCIVVVNGSICIVWHEGKEGKRYIGSWRNKYFDQGEKEGLGLEWVPGRYVYYGQFRDNKRDGFGAMRRNDGTVVLGFWRKGRYQQYGIGKNFVN